MAVLCERGKVRAMPWPAVRLRTGPLLLLVAAAFVLADVTLIWIGAQTDFAFDFTCCYQQAAARLLHDPSTLYDWSETYTFRYTPLGALPFIPFVPLGEAAASWAWVGVKVVVLIGAAAWFAKPWDGRERVLVALLVLAFPPIVHDLMIGNVSTLTLLVFIAVARWPDARGGVAIGLLTLLMPKPHLLPVLAYLAIRRRTEFAAAAATILVGVLIGLGVFGTELWLAFIGTLREPLERTFTANIGFSSLFGPAGVAIGVVAGLAVLAAGFMSGGSRGYGLSIIGGILMGPYTFIHYLAGTLVAAEPILRSHPRRLAPFPWLLVVFPLIPFWLLALAWTIWRTPPPGEATGRPAAEPG
jgi:hypothetical protein